ncbi:hypothetical protein HDU76_008515 [Blyttiomyces sp. JEL0837]|nr:hypothetical protein HDU76_008515 [Blyttiomyces sp. JEL0837]
MEEDVEMGDVNEFDARLQRMAQPQQHQLGVNNSGLKLPDGRPGGVTVSGDTATVSIGDFGGLTLPALSMPARIVESRNAAAAANGGDSKSSSRAGSESSIVGGATSTTNTTPTSQAPTTTITTGSHGAVNNTGRFAFMLGGLSENASSILSAIMDQAPTSPPSAGGNESDDGDGRMGDDRPHKCRINGCNKAYKNPGGLKYHMQHGHAEDTGDPEMNNIISKPYQCPVTECGRRYKNLNGLKYHIEHAHIALLGSIMPASEENM